MCTIFISHVNVELKNNVSEIFSVSIIRIDDGDQGHGWLPEKILVPKSQMWYASRNFEMKISMLYIDSAGKNEY